MKKAEVYAREWDGRNDGILVGNVAPICSFWWLLTIVGYFRSSSGNICVTTFLCIERGGASAVIRHGRRLGYRRLRDLYR